MLEILPWRLFSRREESGASIRKHRMEQYRPHLRQVGEEVRERRGEYIFIMLTVCESACSYVEPIYNIIMCMAYCCYCMTELIWAI